MALYWTYPSNFELELYRSGWKNDKSFSRIVADIGAGQYASVSEENTDFIIKANTINKVRMRDVGALLIPSADGTSKIGPDTRLDGIRLRKV